MYEFYNKHYIAIRQDNVIIDSWSDGPHPEKDTANAICINEKGGYQFRITPNGEENPPMFTIDGIPLYKWDGEKVIARSQEEIGTDRAKIPEPPPSPIEQLRADVDFMSIMLGVSL